jgi:DNA-binding CsgD family transcriptional regulator
MALQRRFDLTERELEVAQLVGEALTNKQIAGRLAMSPHTVNFHLRQIYRKLGTSSRVRLACYMVESLADQLVAKHRDAP